MGYDTIRIMNFCGTHEWTTVHYGLRSILPRKIDLVAGPGCPVCIIPAYYIDKIIELALDNIKIYTYGDVLRLNSVKRKEPPRNIGELKTYGADVTIVYSFLDAIKMAREDRKESIFVGIGFETITPSYSIAFSRNLVPENLKFLSIIRLTPPAMKYTIKINRERGLLPIHGVIAPGHVSTIIGAGAWDFLPRQFNLPTVVAGFEPIDMLIAITQILQMLVNRNYNVLIEYKRVVSWDGNIYAKRLVEKIFDKVYSAWRGIGFIPRSGLKLKEEYHEKYDALKYYNIPDLAPERYIYTHAHHGVPWEYDLPPRCRCGEVVLGIARPTDCPMYMKGCTPEKPWGPCMVSFEGTCNVWARHGEQLIEEV
jgi:hydrogenase expression/formation protein HypD